MSLLSYPVSQVSLLHAPILQVKGEWVDEKN